MAGKSVANENACARILRLQANTENVRNICVVAHVDHGKTSLSDNLVATNGIISARMSGELRYLDSRPDEQERGITMKASAIALHFALASNGSNKELVLNLVDTPGHSDFFVSDVKPSARLCDGALVVVDAVAGISAQTNAVLHRVWLERLTPVLVINKIDRLVDEMRLTPAEAYVHLHRLVQNANAVLAGFYSAAVAASEETSNEFKGETEVFVPQKGNVVFCSATQRWGFRIAYFARLFAARLKLDEQELLATLWGDEYTFDFKNNKKIPFKASKYSDQSLASRYESHPFVKLVLSNIWAIYNACGLGVNAATESKPDVDRVLGIAKKLQIRVPERDLIKWREANTPMASLLLSHWLPVSSAVLAAAADQVPPPSEAQAQRLAAISPGLTCSNDFEELKRAIKRCAKDDDAPVSGYVCRPVTVCAASEQDAARSRAASAIANTKMLNQSEQNYENSFETLVGMSRLYSGKLCVNDIVYVSPHSATEVVKAQVVGLYLLLGQDARPVDQICAGSIFAIKLAKQHCTNEEDDGFLLHDAFFSKSKEFVSCLSSNASSENTGSQAVRLRVAVEPVRLLDLHKLTQGLQKLRRADPSVEVILQETGETVVTAAGDVHLEKIIFDLKTKYAQCEFIVSEPIVQYRETVICDASPLLKLLCNPEIQLAAPYQWTQISLPNGAAKVKSICVKMPSELYLELSEPRKDHETTATIVSRWVKNNTGLEGWKVAATGPGDTGANALLMPASSSLAREILDAGVGAGFQQCVSSGPLCAEPMDGTLFFASVIVVNKDLGNFFSEEKESSEYEDKLLRESQGQVISKARESCRLSFVRAGPRLMLEPMRCVVTCEANAVGAVYAVLGRRRFAKILKDSVLEGTPFHEIDVVVPAIEAFGLERELQKKTSGRINGLRLSSASINDWFLLDQDPCTEINLDDEDEDANESSFDARRTEDLAVTQMQRMVGLGDKNAARDYLLAVRKRKGLSTGTKIVEHAEKQRTLMRKK